MGENDGNKGERMTMWERVMCRDCSGARCLSLKYDAPTRHPERSEGSQRVDVKEGILRFEILRFEILRCAQNDGVGKNDV